VKPVRRRAAVDLSFGHGDHSASVVHRARIGPRRSPANGASGDHGCATVNASLRPWRRWWTRGVPRRRFPP
jgi:hypothetical protein